jgi:hypothetical protein
MRTAQSTIGYREVPPSKREGAVKRKINSEEKWNERDEERQYKGH